MGCRILAYLRQPFTRNTKTTKKHLRLMYPDYMLPRNPTIKAAAMTLLDKMNLKEEDSLRT